MEGASGASQLEMTFLHNANFSGGSCGSLGHDPWTPGVTYPKSICSLDGLVFFSQHVKYCLKWHLDLKGTSTPNFSF